MAIPAQIAAHFRLIESQGFGSFNILFDVPAGPDGLDDGGERRGQGSKDQVIGQFVRVIEAATNHEEVATVERALVEDRQDGPVKEPLALGAQALGESLPVLRAERTLGDAAHISKQRAGGGLDTNDFEIGRAHI